MTDGNWPEPTSVLNDPDVTVGMTKMSEATVEFRLYENTESPHMLVAVLPEQKVAILQDLV